MQKDLVSVIFPTMNRKEDLIKCIKSIKSSSHKKIEIVIVDNGSTDGSQAAVRKLFPNVVLIESDLNLGVPVAFNECIRKSKGEFILRLDDDVLLEKDMIKKMLKVLKSDSKIGATGCLYFYTENPDIMRTSGMEINLFTGKTTIYDRDKPYKNEYAGKLIERNVAGGVLLIRRSTYDKIGFSPEEYFLMYEDVDLCLRLKKAEYKIVIVGDAKLYHKRGGGLSQKENPKRVYHNNRSQVILMKKHAGWRNLFFYPYLLLFLYPAKFVFLLSKKNPKAAKALTKGVFDGLFNNNVFVYDKEGKQVPYKRRGL